MPAHRRSALQQSLPRAVHSPRQTLALSAQVCDTAGSSSDSWRALVAALPLDPPDSSLLSRDALVATIVRVYDARVRDVLASGGGGAGGGDGGAALLAHDGPFDALADHFSRQLAGDGRPLFMPELQAVDGPIGRVLMSCRCALVQLFIQRVVR